MRIIGIDPGITGAVAVLSAEGELLAAFDMPVFKINGKSKIDAHELGRFIARYAEDSRAIIEAVASSPQMGVASAFTFGKAAGMVEGALGACLIPFETVTPPVWKKHFKLTKDKDHARQRASRQWPRQDVFTRVKDAGRAEAALIALWGLEGVGPLRTDEGGR